MVETYRGDTPVKKTVRLDVWRRVQDEMPNFKDKKFLVLAGPEGADVGVALGLGARIQNITAVDKELKAATATRWKYPQADVHHSDLLEAIDGKAFDFAFLDFCGPLTDNTLTLAGLTATESLAFEGGYMAVTFLCGRENPSKEFYQEVLKVKQGIPKTASAQMARAKVVQQQIFRAVRKSSCVTVPMAFWFYQSRHTKNTSGLPMAVYLCRVMKGSRWSNDEANTLANAAKPTFHFMEEKPVLPLHAAKLFAEGLDPALLLNVPKGTLAAWKAHATRGTYG